ncbi:JmjC domain-containing protein [Pasteurella multocida]|uniref:ribosomal protein uL16 3-hydroxylase n=1 Tax=Pasteurella multocida TaxID=747 RepID=UPI0009F5405F|nr:cupin domain-containing protein [Pasteurella multocida]PNM04047.1 cupin domain-containing protein [Pasteurella multocida]URK02441.1 cupin domain-containing protein [Pasteurella multocida]HDR1859009.1 cupin domain-containing protein [Pasteurella multocida]HDR1893449.1 cupin domain-containing protein [Pasteurella multocida]
MKFCLPEHITPEIFLRDYWQKQPLLIRNGLPEIVGMFEPADIIELAQQEEVTSRLVKQFSEDNWQLKRSPLTAKDFKNLPEQWSVLVQNLEQWSPELGQLWHAFGFIPQWQRDDIMVSYAPAGGSVGRHYDEYDVFLVQGYGHRRWQLGKWCDPSTEFKANQPIRIFDDMGELILDEVMAPGDILYVPSRLSHYGVAQDDCLTFSFGLRYPNVADLFDNINKGICQALPEIDLTELNIPLRLSPAVQATGKLDPVMVENMKQQFFAKLANSAQFDRLFQHAVATTVSSRRYELLETEGYCDLDEVRSILAENGTIVQDNNCKLLYLENPLRVYANGEWLDELNEIEAQVLKALADGQQLDFAFLTQLCAQAEDPDSTLDLLLDSLCNWLDDGWILLE